METGTPPHELTPIARGGTTRIPRRRAGLLATILIAGGAMAGVAGRAVAQQNARTLLATEAMNNPDVIDTLVFSGGTMQDLVAALRETIQQHGQPFNVILRRDAAMIPVAPLSLKGVTPGAAIQVSVEQWGQWTESDGGEDIERYRDFEVVQGPIGAPVYVVDGWEVRRSTTPMAGAAPASNEIRVFPLARAVGKTSTDEQRAARLRLVLSAVEMAIKFGAGDHVESLVHTDTELLFLRGPEDAVERLRPVIEQAIGEIADQTPRENDRAPAAYLRERYRENWRALELARTQRPVLEARIDRMRALQDDDAVKLDEIQELEMSLAEMRINMSIAYDTLRELVDDMTARGIQLPELEAKPPLDARGGVGPAVGTKHE